MSNTEHDIKCHHGWNQKLIHVTIPDFTWVFIKFGDSQVMYPNTVEINGKLLLFIVIII